MIGDVIVAAALVLTSAFVATWAWSPALRGRIEQPKYRFMEAAADYDRGDGGRREPS